MKNLPDFKAELTDLCAKYGVGEGWNIPDHIASHRIVQWLESGMPEIELKNDSPELTKAYEHEAKLARHNHQPYDLCGRGCPVADEQARRREMATRRHENEESVAEDTVPNLYVGSEVKVNNETFIVTDFNNSFDRPARAGLMAIAEIQQAATEGESPNYARRRRGFPMYPGRG